MTTLKDAAWRKSSRSGGTGGNCVEIAFIPGATAIRDSKDPYGHALVLPPATWATFLASLKADSPA